MSHNLPVDLTRVAIVWATENVTDANRRAIHNGEVLKLSQSSGDRLEFFANGRLAGRGEMVHVEGKLGVRVTQLVAPDRTPEESV